MKIKICLLFLVLSITACQSNKKKSTEQKEEIPKMEIILQPLETIVYEDEKFTVVVTPLEDIMSFDFHLYNHETHKKYDFSGKEKELMYEGVVNNYLLVHDGYGHFSSVIIIDMNIGEIVQDISCYDDVIIITDDRMYYYTTVYTDEIPKGAELPDCPQESFGSKEFAGYLEKLYFDFNTKKINSTGEYLCYYSL